MTLLNRAGFLVKTANQLFQGRVPGQVVIQMTDHCNAHCPHCGMNVSNSFLRKRLSNDEIKQIIDAAVKNGVEALSFTGGEPMLLLDDLVELIKYAGTSGIRFIRTGTNGYFMKSDNMNPDKFNARIAKIAAKLADTPLRNFWISMDSCVPDVHEQMRGFTNVVRGIEQALPIFHDHGIYPSVNLGVTRNVGGSFTSDLDARCFNNQEAYLEAFRRHYRNAFQRFYRRVIGMGFTILNTCYPMSVDSRHQLDMQAVYAATSSDRVVAFSDAEKAILFEVLMECVTKYRSQIRIFSPLTPLYTLHRHYRGDSPDRHPSSACRGGIDFFFIDAQTCDTFPCGYRGNESLGKYWELDTRHVDVKSECRLCDWECFRDPSELFSPLLNVVSSPSTILDRVKHDQPYLRYWLSDMRYYRACDFFDGRRPPKWPSIRHAANFTRHISPQFFTPTLTEA